MNPPTPLQPQSKRRLLARLPLLILAAIALFVGLWAGLQRLGWPVPWLSLRLPAQHGPLMISGFLGTLISLERAVAMSMNTDRRWWYGMAPLLSGLGALALILGLPPVVSRGLSTLGALGLGLIFFVIYRLRPSADHLVMGIGALLWLIGNSLWLADLPVFLIVPWWAGFLVLTIAGERLELARMLLHKKFSRQSFLISISLFLIGLILTLVSLDAGLRIAGVGLILLGLWLLRFDIARHTIRKTGITRFIAACLLPGYFWLIAGGLLWVVVGGQYVAGPYYDSLLHSVFLGFVFSMIFGHALIIFPAILQVRVSYSPVFYIPLILLHLSLVLRIVGDLFLCIHVRRWGGLLNETAIVLFLVIMVGVLRFSKQAG